MPFSESCELLLAAACLVAALVAHQERHHWRVLGLLLIAGTSLVGSRLAGAQMELRLVHQALSTHSWDISLLLIAIGSVRGTTRHLVVIALAALFSWFPNPLVLTGNIIILCLMALPWRSRNWPYAAAGSLLFAIATLAVGLHGEWLGIQRQDLSHLLLMLAILSWMLAQLDGTRWARSPSPFLTS